MSLKKAISLINKSRSFVISTHLNPDPDALCSEMALYYFLKSKGKKVRIINNEAVPERLRFLSGTKVIEAVRLDMKADFEVGIVVDCGSLSRVGKVMRLFEKKSVINIDHHLTNDNFGAVNVVWPKASSTSEILFDLLKQAHCRFSEAIAYHLYAGIMTDTGSFRYENTTAHTHEIVAQLRQFKFSASRLYQQLYEMMPLHDMKQFIRIVSHFSELFNGKVLCVQLKKSVLSKFSDDFDLRDAIFKFLRSIKGTDVIVIFTEDKKNRTRVNFRSSGRVNVAKAAHYFEGGGHHNASGCVIEKDMMQTKRMVIRKLKEWV